MAVYFITPVGADTPVRIGSTERPEKRVIELMNFSPVPLEIVASAPGSYIAEKLLHFRFSEHRLHGEWFRGVPEIWAFIARVRAGLPEDELPPALSGYEPRLRFRRNAWQIGRAHGLTAADIAERAGVGVEAVRCGGALLACFVVIDMLKERGITITWNDLVVWQPARRDILGPAPSSKRAA